MQYFYAHWPIKSELQPLLSRQPFDWSIYCAISQRKAEILHEHYVCETVNYTIAQFIQQLGLWGVAQTLLLSGK